MYLSLSKAAAELAKRQRDPRLKQRVLDFVGGTLPEGFPAYPIAIFPRQMASCRFEDLAFQEEALSIGLEPWAPTYLGDRYLCSNPDKVNYVKFRVLRERRQMLKVKLVDDMDHLSRQRPLLREIATNRHDDSGNPWSLQDLHMAMRQQVLKVPNRTFDISAWFALQAKRAGAPAEATSLSRYYYPANLAQFIVHAVMFEDYHNGPNQARLAEFRRVNVDPALKVLERELGLEPLIVQFEWREDFDLYPPEVVAAIPPRAPKTPVLARC